MDFHADDGFVTQGACSSSCIRTDGPRVFPLLILGSQSYDPPRGVYGNTLGPSCGVSVGGARTKNDCFSSVWINVKIRIGGLFAHPQMVRAGEKERLCNFRSSEEHVLAEEGLAGSVERLDGFGCTPAVAFALVEVVFVGDIAAAQGRDDFLGL